MVGLIVETSAEITGCRWIRQARRSERFEHDSILPSQLDVFQPLSATKHVVRDVQHVVGLVIRLVNLQHSHVCVDRFGQPKPAYHTLHCTHSAVCDSARLRGDLVLNVPASQHRPPGVHRNSRLQLLLDSPLLTRHSLPYDLLHSKSPLSCFDCC